MKKKILGMGIIIMLLLVLVTLTGCGNENNSEGEQQQEVSKNSLASKVKVGDYVAYNAGSGNTYTSSKDKNGNSDRTYETTGSEKWRVMNINDDGTVELVSEDGLLSKEEKALQITGAKGYANAIEELNNICSIYGKGENAISARSMNYEDAIKIIGIDTLAKYFEEDLSTYTTEEEKIDKIMELLAKKNDTNPNNNYGNELKKDEGYNYIPDANSQDGYSQANTLNEKDSYIYITHIESDMINDKDKMTVLVGTEDGKGCWLATDYAAQSSTNWGKNNRVVFGLYNTGAVFNVLRNCIISPTNIIVSDKTTPSDPTSFLIRPVVELDKNTTLKNENGDGSRDNPYII